MGALFPHANFNGKYCESSAKWVGAMHFFSRIKSNYALSLAFRLRFYAILTFSGFFNLADHHQKIIWPFQISVRFVFKKTIFFYFMVSDIFNISRLSSLSSSGSFMREKRDLTLPTPSSQVNISFLESWFGNFLPACEISTGNQQYKTFSNNLRKPFSSNQINQPPRSFQISEEITTWINKEY